MAYVYIYTVKIEYIYYEHKIDYNHYNSILRWLSYNFAAKISFGFYFYTSRHVTLLRSARDLRFLNPLDRLSPQNIIITFLLELFDRSRNGVYTTKTCLRATTRARDTRVSRPIRSESLERSRRNNSDTRLHSPV